MRGGIKSRAWEWYDFPMVEGASKKELIYLDKMEIEDDASLLFHLPRRYENFNLTPKDRFFRFVNGEKAVFYGSLASAIHQQRFAKTSKCTFYFHTSYGLDVFFAAWNRPYLSKVIKEGEFYTLQGSYDEKNHCFNLMAVKKGELEVRFIPVYSLPDGFPEHRFIRLIDLALERGTPDIIPLYLREKYRLPTRLEAFRLCHHPHTMEELSAGYRYFKYEEALLFSLRNAMSKAKKEEIEKRGYPKVNRPSLDRFLSSLPFSLTPDQMTALEEALKDMDSPHPMNRLLQGDVGTGKTAVAAALMAANATRHKQSALMAPTEALARQHAKTLSAFYGDHLKVALLLGSTPSAERHKILDGIEDGSISVIVGTHALFSSPVIYSKLGLVIIDEQHKFGVQQRLALLSKGSEADLLLMSATPIPRTLALTLYGDMDVSTLEVFPSKKRQVETRLIPPRDKSIKKSIDKTLEEGGQIYAVAPQIEDDETPGFVSAKKLYDAFEKVYGEQVCLLHGKMKPEEKEEALESFVSGEKKILVATSVIEVGIDVPKARLLLVYEASHFSLSSLHQLRGRIGRDGHEALCLLIERPEDEESARKLEVLVSSNDGFEISRADLSIRGFGELSGNRQSGLIDLRFASVVDDYKMFQVAAKDAKEIIASPSRETAPLIRLARQKAVGRG